jgi:acetoin utilization deacetylase AcuC-like enzyme
MQIPTVWTEAHRLHVPAGEVWVGVRIAGTETVERLEAIQHAIVQAGGLITAPADYPDEILESVHDPTFLSYLAGAWSRWEASTYPRDPGQDRVVPYVFPLPQLTVGHSPKLPFSVGALSGVYAMDTMTLIGPGTWEAVRAAALCSITAADLVHDGEPVAYAAVRPPGHHAGRDFYGGSCYLNNSALAAQRLRDLGLGSVGIVDLDAHHGNGTQEIFYRRGDVRYGSVHVDPGAGWFPHFVGFADETGLDEGEGANLNLPLAPGTGDAGWLAGVDRLLSFVDGAGALVVSLGLDAVASDPESPLTVSPAGYVEAGRRIGALGLPTVIVQEGGYHLPTIGDLVVGFLRGVEEGEP